MKGLFLGFGIVLAVLFAGCTNLVTEGGGAAPAKDCVSDFACFVSAMQDNCAKAKVTVLENGVTAKLEVKGASADAGCDVLIKMTDIQKTPDMPESVWKAIEASKAGLPLLDMTCPITAEKAQGLYDTKQVLAAKEVFDKCKGSLKDIALLVVKQNAQGEGAALFSASVSVFAPEIMSGATAGIVAVGTNGKEPYRYDFEFGDGRSSMNAIEATQEHQYVNEGNAPVEYTVKVTVRDADGARALAEARVKVNPKTTAAPEVPAQPAALDSCTETDGPAGEAKYAVRGTTKLLRADGLTEKYNDECLGQAMLREYSCESNTVQMRNPNCNDVLPGTVCKGGACLKLENKCVDAEGQVNISVEGALMVSYTQGGSTSLEDICRDGKLIEYSCNREGTRYQEEAVTCPQGTSCVEGACIATQATAQPADLTSCTETDGNAGEAKYGVSGMTTQTNSAGHIVQQSLDDCLTGAILREYSCSGNTIQVRNITCNDVLPGTACTRGACVASQAQPPAPAQPAALSSCTETDGSDGAAKYAVRGITKAVLADGSVVTKADECSSADGRIITEYFCLNGAISNVTNYCGAYITGSPHCSKGACVKNEAGCFDGDGRADYSVAATVTWTNQNGTVTNDDDHCDGNMLYEYYCADAYRNTRVINCTSMGKTCTDGKCA